MTLNLTHTNGADDGEGTGEQAGLLLGTNRAGTLETCDTFHTANSDCSFVSALNTPALNSLNQLIPTPSSTEDGTESDTGDRDYEEATSNGGLLHGGMSDSGVSFETNRATDTAAALHTEADENESEGSVDRQSSGAASGTAKLLFQSDDHCLLLATSSTPNPKYGGKKLPTTTTTVIVTDGGGLLKSNQQQPQQSPRMRHKSSDSEEERTTITTMSSIGTPGSNRLKLSVPNRNRSNSNNSKSSSMRTEIFEAEQTNPTNNKRVLYIPYRDSILTWLLKDSLGGNSKTIMIAAISPADVNYSETLSTLRYANRAKNIINKPTINEDPNVKLIRELRDEIYKLKLMLSSDSGAELEPQLKVLEDLHKKEAQEKVLTEEWAEKWREAQSILREQRSLGLRKSGVGVVLDSEVPHLIGIHDDISTGVTLYSLKEGETTIGTDEAPYPQDISLNGIGIAPEHCRIVLSNGNATIYPNPNATCLLNASIIEVPTAISQGDILLLGRTNMFRYNNPAEAAKMRQESSHQQRASRLDLSRLSLIAASRENLCASFMSDDDGGVSGSSLSLFGGGGGAGGMASPQGAFRFRQYTPSREDAELQDEHRKILQTIENALRQLNLERTRMHEQFKHKIRLCTEELERLESTKRDRLTVLDCRIGELMARKEMVLWEKSNEKTQVRAGHRWDHIDLILSLVFSAIRVLHHFVG